MCSSRKEQAAAVWQKEKLGPGLKKKGRRRRAKEGKKKEAVINVVSLAR